MYDLVVDTVMAASERTCLSIALAAGKGTRMRSELPKVLHPIAQQAMVAHVLQAATAAGSDRIAVVVGHGADQLRNALDPSISTYEQTEQLGTAHAVLAAREAIERGADDVLVLFGDTPLLRPKTLKRAREAIAGSGAAIAVIGFETDQPDGYGRLLTESGELVAIREHRDASDDERKVTLCNGGIMAFAGEAMLGLLDGIGRESGEYYLTDAVEIARTRGLRCIVVPAAADEVLGVNDRVQLAEAEAIWQWRRRRELMEAGASLPAPETVFLAHDTVIEPEASVGPFVTFGPGAIVRSGATILPHCHIEGATVERGSNVGPFARLRPGTVVGEGAKVGNFCEVKNAELGAGAKVNHLTYIGDASVGEAANIGAGTITCNYDGANKHRTEIGADSFIGSNSALVAPVRVGDGAYVASGSVITRDVADDALAFGRARQVEREGGGRNLREKVRAEKARRAQDSQ